MSHEPVCVGISEFCAEICEHSKYVIKHLRKKNSGIRIMEQGAT